MKGASLGNYLMKELETFRIVFMLNVEWPCDPGYASMFTMRDGGEF